MTWRAARFGFIWVARATSRPREGALWVAHVLRALQTRLGSHEVACGSAGGRNDPRRARVAKAVALPCNCSCAARARGQPQTLDFDCWTRWAHFAVVRVCVKLDCDALGQRNVKFVVCVFTLRQSNQRG